jgi:hypothetical protein
MGRNGEWWAAGIGRAEAVSSSEKRRGEEGRASSNRELIFGREGRRDEQAAAAIRISPPLTATLQPLRTVGCVVLTKRGLGNRTSRSTECSRPLRT